MNLQNLPKKSRLRKLLSTCQLSHEHELERIIAHDGGIILSCSECYFHHVLSVEEEEIFLQEESLLDSAQSEVL